MSSGPDPNRQQILDALDREPDLRSDILGVVFEGLRWAYPYRLASRVRPSGNTVTIRISGEVATTWYLVASEEGWEFAEVPGEQAAVVTLSTDEGWRLLTNNLSPERKDALEMSGDPELLELVRNTRAILGTPK